MRGYSKYLVYAEPKQQRTVEPFDMSGVPTPRRSWRNLRRSARLYPLLSANPLAHLPGFGTPALPNMH